MVQIRPLHELDRNMMNCFIFGFGFQASQDKKSLDVGANLFVGNLDPVRNEILEPTCQRHTCTRTKRKKIQKQLHTRIFFEHFVTIMRHCNSLRIPLCPCHYFTNLIDFDILCRMWMRNFYMILSVHSESLLQTPRSVLLRLLSGVVLLFVYCLLSIDSTHTDFEKTFFHPLDFYSRVLFLVRIMVIFDPLFALSIIV